MRVANWLLTLIINLAFGLGAASDLGTAQPSPAVPHAAAIQRSCPFLHRDKASRPISPSHYLAAVRMGWSIG
ncbi:MAG: hypothetical protein WA747_09640 [Steroidobacteraceae bacterium]